MRKILIIINLIVLIGCKKSEDGTVEVVPLAPTELKVTIASKTQADLTWKDNSTNETGYKIERKTDNGVFSEVGSTTTDVTNFSDKKVSLYTNYTYRIYSFNKAGKSIQYSNEVGTNFFVFGTVVGATGRIWMDRNLGASRVATSINDAASFGDYYQWGRNSDGHELSSSKTTNSLSSTNSPGHGLFIKTSAQPHDWRSPQNNNLWQGVNGINNPCPPGFRLPTEAEWNAEKSTFKPGWAQGAFESPLKLPAAGYRFRISTSGIGLIPYAYYWSSSTIGGVYAFALHFNSGAPMINTMTLEQRSQGFCVRCIKD